MSIGLQRVGGVVIDEVDLRALSDADFEAFARYENARRAEAEPDDPPQSLASLRAWVEHMPSFIVARAFWGRDERGQLVATAQTSWEDVAENRHLVRTGISVLPAHRRRGVARALLSLVAGAADEAGRTLLAAVTSGSVPAGEAFARRIGAEVGLAQHVNRLAVREVDPALVARWIEQGPQRAPGYSLVAIDGDYPDELIDEIVDLGNVMNTAPRDDMDVEDSIWTADQARERDKAIFATGAERWYLAARHDDTGRLVGWTEVSWDPDIPATVWQWGTGVRPEHRGHAIGKWLKAVMLERVMRERPDVVDVRTGNADSNDAMLGINHALGFKPYQSHVMWQVKVERVRAYLAGTST